MEKDLSRSLMDLFINRRFAEVIKITDELLLRNPLDFSLRYCSGIGYVSCGQHSRGLSRLMGIIQAYYNLPDHRHISAETKLLIGYSGLQLAQLAAFYGMCPERHLTLSQSCSYINNGVNLAKIIAEELKEAKLKKSAEEVSNHLWSIADIKQPEIERVYIHPDSPLCLQPEPTNYCNLRCRMCPHSYMSRRKGFLDPVLWSEILASWSNRVSRLSINHLVHNIVLNYEYPGIVKLFFMGEPLLHPQIDRLIIEARKAGCLVGVQTNGTLLKEEGMRHKLLKAMPSEISISIEGINKDTYETIMQGASWDSLIKGLRQLNRQRQEMGLADSVKFFISTIIAEDTDSNRRPVLDFLRELKPLVDNISFVALDRRYEGEFIDSNGRITSYHSSVWPRGSSGQPFCSEPLTKLNILWDGTVTPCSNDIDGRLRLGHAQKGIDNVWQDDETKRFQRDILSGAVESLPFCRACLNQDLREYVSLKNPVLPLKN